jgi:hypothetical protein
MRESTPRLIDMKPSATRRSRVRYQLAFDAALTRAVLRVFLWTVFGWQRRRAAGRGLVGARSGSLTAIRWRRREVGTTPPRTVITESCRAEGLAASAAPP